MAAKAFSSSIEQLFEAIRAGESPSKLLRVQAGPSISPVQENLLATGPIEQQSPRSLVHFIKGHAYEFVPARVSRTPDDSAQQLLTRIAGVGRFSLAYHGWPSAICRAEKELLH